MSEANEVGRWLRAMLLAMMLCLMGAIMFKGVTMLERCVVNLENIEMDLRKIADRSQPLPAP